MSATATAPPTLAGWPALVHPDLSMRPAPLRVAVVGADADRSRLLVATLYALGCRIHSVDDGSRAPERAVAEWRLQISTADVVVWDVTRDAKHHVLDLERLVATGEIETRRLILLIDRPHGTVPSMPRGCASARLLPPPYAAVALMNAVVEVAAGAGRLAPAISS